MKSDKREGAGYYRLHTDAVEDLVGASKENTPQYSREELEKYRSAKSRLTLPGMLKVGFIKAWFYGAICYFVFWGLGLYVIAQLDLWVAAAIIMGLVTDLLINVFLRFMEKREGESRAYIMVGLRGVAGLALNILYGGVLMFLVITAYGVINAALRAASGGALFLGVEPIGFGLIAALADTLLIRCKHLFIRIADDARRTAPGKGKK